jgi:hypothetical protein
MDREKKLEWENRGEYPPKFSAYRDFSLAYPNFLTGLD